MVRDVASKLTVQPSSVNVETPASDALRSLLLNMWAVFGGRDGCNITCAEPIETMVSLLATLTLCPPIGVIKGRSFESLSLSSK